MLTHKILTQQDLNQVANYYEDSADDYYAKESEASIWQGQGAHRLHLSGRVDRKTFRQLLEGKTSSKAVSTRSSIRTDNKTRLGIDLTFSAPKSVSLQALIGGDQRLIEAHDQAVSQALALAETRAQARYKIKGKSQVETTGNLIMAKFRHETNRTVDPQLHTHCVIMNLTQRQDGQWRALRNDDIIKTTRYLGAVYRAELAKKITSLGYTLRLERQGMFELSHMSRQHIEAFSERAQDIEAELKRQGLNRETATTAQKQTVTLKTRRRKEAQERTVVFQQWQQKAHDIGLNFTACLSNEATKDQHQASQQKDDLAKIQEKARQEAAQRSLRYALNHLTERQAVIDESVLLETALQHGMGSTTLREIQSCLEQQVQQGRVILAEPQYYAEGKHQTAAKPQQVWRQTMIQHGLTSTQAKSYVDHAIQIGRLIETEHRYTTQTAQEREKTILKIERTGRNAYPPWMTAVHILEKLKPFTLNKGQQEAAVLMATTSHQIVGIQGFAGVGKSHMLKAAKSVIEQQHVNVVALAPYNTQVESLQELGVKARTVASFLHAKDKEIDDRTLLVVDEAGVLPTRQMHQLLQEVRKAGARVVLMGDVAQTKAIEAGRPFAQLQAAGMATASMTDIQRQRNNPTLKKAVEQAARGHTAASLAHVTSVTELEEASARYAYIAKIYAERTPEAQANTVVVSGTNQARREINQMIRHQLDLQGRGVEVEILIQRDTTAAERCFAKNYHVNDRIQPEKDYANGLKRGCVYRILDTGAGNHLTVQAPSGDIIKFSPNRYRRLSVYEAQSAELKRGDRVRINRNDKKLGVNNGDRLTVSAFDKKYITLTNDKKKIRLLRHQPLYLDYAYATTVNNSQSFTKETAILDINTRSRTTHKDMLYVGISRASQEAHIVTDDISRLPGAVMRDSVKTAALDITKGAKQQPDHVDPQKQDWEREI